MTVGRNGGGGSRTGRRRSERWPSSGGGAFVFRDAGRMAVGHIRRSRTGPAALGGGCGCRAVTAFRPASVGACQIGQGKAFTADAGRRELSRGDENPPFLQAATHPDPPRPDDRQAEDTHWNVRPRPRQEACGRAAGRAASGAEGACDPAGSVGPAFSEPASSDMQARRFLFPPISECARKADLAEMPGGVRLGAWILPLPPLSGPTAPSVCAPTIPCPWSWPTPISRRAARCF